MYGRMFNEPMNSLTGQMCVVLILQYYMYELLDDGVNETAVSPSAACPFAIVSFSYTDTKTIVAKPLEKRYYMQRTLFSEYWYAPDLIAFLFYVV